MQWALVQLLVVVVGALVGLTSVLEVAPVLVEALEREEEVNQVALGVMLQSLNLRMAMKVELPELLPQLRDDGEVDEYNSRSHVL